MDADELAKKETAENQRAEIIKLLNKLIKTNEGINETMTDMINLFKRYEIEEVMYNENLRDG